MGIRADPLGRDHPVDLRALDTAALGEHDVARLNQREITDSVGDSYTRQVRDGLSRLKAMIAETSDPELLSVLLREGIEEEVVDDVELHDALAS